MKRAMRAAMPLFLAVLFALSQPALAQRQARCTFKEMKPDRRGWARFQCSDCSIVTVKQGPWSQRHVAKSVCAQVVPGAPVKIFQPKKPKPPTAKPVDPPQERHPIGELEIRILIDLIKTDCGELRSCYEPLIKKLRYSRE